MPIRKLQEIGGESAGITLPKGRLRELGVIDDNGDMDEQYLRIRYIDEGNRMKFELEFLG